LKRNKEHPKVLFVSAYNSTFVKQDLEILIKKFNVRTAIFPKVRKDPFYLLYTFIKIFLEVAVTDVSYAVFADLRAYFTVLCCRILKKRSLIMIGGYESAKIPEINYGGLLKKGQAKRFRFILKYADRIFTVSEFSKQEVLEFYPAGKIEVISLGSLPDKIIPLKGKREYVVSVGSADQKTWKLKGFEYFARASLAFPEMKFMIIGKYSEIIKAKLTEINPAIEFPGFISHDELKLILSKTKVYCQLSMRESFGLSVLEAMRFGCIPVVTDSGALPEVIGNTGYLTEYGNVEKTIDAIKDAIAEGDPNKIIERAKNVFSLKIRESKISTIIEDLYAN